MNQELTLSGQRVFEDPDFILLRTKGLLGLTHPFISPFVVYLKFRSAFVKVTGREKRFLLAVLGEMAALGLTPQQIKSASVLPEFCTAVSARGGARWELFFNRSTAKETARGFASA